MMSIKDPYRQRYQTSRLFRDLVMAGIMLAVLILAKGCG